MRMDEQHISYQNIDILLPNCREKQQNVISVVEIIYRAQSFKIYIYIHIANIQLFIGNAEHCSSDIC